MPPVARGSAAPTTTMQGSHYLRLELERSDRADNNEGVDWTGLDWAHAASGVFCDALPSSSPLAFALLELGRHLINLYLAFTQIRMAIGLNSLCLCPESCWLKCITQCICTLALLHCPGHMPTAQALDWPIRTIQRSIGASARSVPDRADELSCRHYQK